MTADSTAKVKGQQPWTQSIEIQIPFLVNTIALEKGAELMIYRATVPKKAMAKRSLSIGLSSAKVPKK